MVAVNAKCIYVSTIFQKFVDAGVDVRGRASRVFYEALQITLHIADMVRSINGQVKEFEKNLSKVRQITLRLALAHD